MSVDKRTPADRGWVETSATSRGTEWRRRDGVLVWGPVGAVGGRWAISIPTGHATVTHAALGHFHVDADAGMAWVNELWPLGFFNTGTDAG